MKNEQDVNAKLVEALKKIADWKLPDTGKFWAEEQKRPVSYEAAYGSNGAKDYIRNIAKEALSSLPETPKAIVPEMTDEEIEKEFDKLWKEKDWGNIRFDLTIADIYNLAHTAFEKGIGKRTASSDKKVSRPMYIDRDKAIEIVKSTLYATLGNTGTGKDTLLCTEIVDALLSSGTFREPLTFEEWVKIYGMHYDIRDQSDHSILFDRYEYGYLTAFKNKE